ncbi:MAG: hypothetical protein AB7H88_01310 [Vicinamibacterales bacterium]
MHRSTLLTFAAATVMLGSSLACERAKSANPLSPDIAGPIPGVQITAPKPLEPAGGAQLTVQGAAPVTLVLENAGTSGQRPIWQELDLAADPAFQQILHQASRLTPGSDGRTTYRTPDALSPGRTYYWRARAMDGANTGPYSEVAAFTLIEPVVIETPTPVAPSGTISTNHPEFVATNGRISGPVAGTVVYRFELANQPDPSATIAVVTVTPGSTGTTSMSVGDLPYDTTYYWRVYATDGETTSPYSGVMSFRTPPAPTTTAPTPGAPPPGGTPPPGTVGPPRTISIDEALAIVRRVHDQEGWNLGSSSTRESRVQFLFRAVAVIHYGHPVFNPQGPDANWCVKDAGGGRPPSDDVIVRCDSRDAWDLIGGAGANGYTFHDDYIGRLPSGQNVYPPPASALP